MDQFFNQVIERTDGTQYWYWNVACIVERMHGPNALLIRAAMPIELGFSVAHNTNGVLHTTPVVLHTTPNFGRRCRDVRSMTLLSNHAASVRSTASRMR